LIEAFARVGDPRAKLLIVGDFGDVFHTNVGELRAAVERLGLADRVRFTGYVPDEDLVHLYNRAYALILPSLMEGFGLPAVEAMACGVPVLSSTAGSLPEVVGEGGIFFDPTDVRAISDAMESLLADPREQYRRGRAALERSRRFTWTAAAEGLLDCLERVVRERKPRRLSA
jgi:glycosyltransferase involved in cell wall biosynthesis